MRWTPAFLVVLGLFMLGMAFIDVPLTIYDKLCTEERQRAVHLMRHGMTPAQLSQVFNSMDPDPAANHALENLARPLGPAVEINGSVFFVVGLITLGWGVAEIRARRAAAFRRAHPIIRTRCSTCGCDRAGADPATPCPECGDLLRP